MPARRVLLLALAVLSVLAIAFGGVLVGRRIAAASREPHRFGVYYSPEVRPDDLRALAKRLQRIPGVQSAGYLDGNAALQRLQGDMKRRPDDFIPQVMGEPALSMLDIQIAEPWYIWTRRQVVRAIERDPTFNTVEGIPPPPGGWIIPLR